MKFTKKIILNTSLLLLLTPFCQITLADVNISKKYAPYVGYQHSHTNFNFGGGQTNLKYTPRIFMGATPIKTEKFQFGAEIGYTLPATAKNQDIELKRSNTDLFLTALRPLGKNSHWFVQPGIEYQKKHYSYYENSTSDSSIYLGAKTGVGYVFNNGVSLNTTVGTRFVDLKDNSKPKKFIFGINAQYAF